MLRRRFGLCLACAKRTRFIRQHHGNAVADRIGEPRLFRDQFVALAVVDQRAARERAHQYLQQLRVQRRRRSVRHCSVSRSEEHTSELQSLMRISYAVFCLKKTTNTAFYKMSDTVR